MEAAPIMYSMVEEGESEEERERGTNLRDFFMYTAIPPPILLL